MRQDNARRAIAFECPYCGWPSHSSYEAWQEDSEWDRFWPQLREANEDEHDVRSGRKFTEFEMPRPLDVEEAVSLMSWDLFFYTRGFREMSPREQRWAQIALIAALLPIAILANSLRIVSTVVLGQYNHDFAVGTMHSAAGYVVITVCAAACILLHRGMTKIHSHVADKH